MNNCRSCGGIGDDRCISSAYNKDYQRYPQQSCAIPLEGTCACRGLSCPGSSNCTTTTYVGFRGSTISGYPLQTAYQIVGINKFSITGVFADFFNSIDSEVDKINTGPVGGGISSVGADGAVTDSKLNEAQIVDQQAQAGTVTTPVAGPVTAPVAEPVTPPVAAPVAEAVAEPVTTPVAAPVAEPVAVPVAEPVAEPVAAPVEALAQVDELAYAPSPADGETLLPLAQVDELAYAPSPADGETLLPAPAPAPF
jgi:hypothetical protein